MKKLISSFLALAGLVTPIRAQTYIQYADSADNYIKAEDWVRAERAILSALRTEPGNPSNAMLAANLGIVRNRLGDYRGALESFDLTLARVPRSSIALTGQAEALIALGRSGEALASLDRAIETDSTLTLPLTMKGYLLLRENRPDEALPVFDQLGRVSPKEALAYSGKGDALANLGRIREAVSEYRRALELEERPEWRLRAGLLLLELDDLEGAAEQARLSIAANPRDGNIYILMVRLHRRRFESQEAESAEKLARELGADPELLDELRVKR